MYRVISLLKRNPSLTHQQFREYYETKHCLLGVETFNGYALSYERYYLYPMSTDSAGPVYDAVTQMCFPDRNAWDTCTAAVWNNPEKAKRIVEDEQNFLDRAACMHLEAQDSFSELQPLPVNDGLFRTIWFARRRAGMTHEQCRDYYENKHRLLGEYLINGYAYSYDRHYLYKLAPDGPEPHYTFMMEMNFPSPAGLERVSENVAADLTLGQLIAEDEARFIDRSSAVHYVAEFSASALKPLAFISNA